MATSWSKLASGGSVDKWMGGLQQGLVLVGIVKTGHTLLDIANIIQRDFTSKIFELIVFKNPLNGFKTQEESDNNYIL